MVYFDRVLETSTTTGTGSYTLAGAQTGYQSFSVVGNGNLATYSAWAVDAGGNPTGVWEVGVGTWATGGVLARTTFLASSTGSPISWAAGTKWIALTIAAAKLGTMAEQNANAVALTGPATITGSSVNDEFSLFTLSSTFNPSADGFYGYGSIFRSISDPANTKNIVHLRSASFVADNQGSGNVTAIESLSVNAFQDGSGNVTRLIGTSFDVEHYGAGTITNLWGLNFAFIGNSGLGTVTNQSALYIPALLNSGGGTVTNSYALNIADQTAASNNWAIKTGLGRVQLGGALDAPSLQAGTVSATTGALKLAHASSAFLTTLQAGNAAAARTYTWPTNFGAAGTVLTDAAGDGTLSWAAGSSVSLSAAQTWTGVQQFGTIGGAVSKLAIAGATSGKAILDAPAVAGTAVITLPGITSTLATLALNTLTRLQTITQGTANEGILASTGYSLTGSDQTSMLNFTGTLNTSGTPAVWLLNLTNTASNANSLFQDFQIAGASKFAFRLDSELQAKHATTSGIPGFKAINSGGHHFALWCGGSASSPWGDVGVLYSSFGGITMRADSGTYVRFNFDSTTNVLAASTTGYRLASSMMVGWSSTTDATATADAILTRSAAATIQQGAANAASPVAQTLQAQGSRAGTDSNVGGANYTWQPGTGTGTGTAASAIISAPTVAVSGTGTQTIAEICRFNTTTGVTVKSGVALQLGNAAVTGLAAGVLAATTNATLTITDSAGQVYRVPCII